MARITYDERPAAAFAATRERPDDGAWRAAMRARCAHPHQVAGTATALPLPQSSVDGAWPSTVVHHLPDLGAAARDLRRVVRPGGPVLIRSAFPGDAPSVRAARAAVTSGGDGRRR